MNLKISPINTACLILGSQTSLANVLGVSSPTVNEWCNSDKPIPVIQAVKIEAATGGKVTRQQLRPNDFWLIWPDLAHLAPAKDAA